jgi:hypothetical protein|tara:strand:+ start:960 stop:1160 length:201 start_codon:yes stop_codon:yes gene_type:complete
MAPSNKFSKLVEELANTWWRWMKADTLCRDDNNEYSSNERAAAARYCEVLIKEEYKIVAEMNQFFE